MWAHFGHSYHVSTSPAHRSSCALRAMQGLRHHDVSEIRCGGPQPIVATLCLVHLRPTVVGHTAKLSNDRVVRRTRAWIRERSTKNSLVQVWRLADLVAALYWTDLRLGQANALLRAITTARMAQHRKNNGKARFEPKFAI